MHGDPMKKLKFTLICNKKVEIESVTSYFITNNMIKFKIDNTLYKYDINKTTLLKKNNDTIIFIDPTLKVINILLRKEGYNFDMFIDNINVLKGNNSIEFEYSTYETDDNMNHIKIAIKW